VFRLFSPRRAARVAARSPLSLLRCRRLLSVERLEERAMLASDSVLDWNAVALQAVANDHTPSIVSTPDQGGPTHTSRALAIVHAAIFDAVNSIDRSFVPYVAAKGGAKGASIDAAVARAAHDTLVNLYPTQKGFFDDKLVEALDAIPNGRAENLGQVVGAFVAKAILAARKKDGSNAPMDYTPGSDPGDHQVDPLHPDQGVLTPNWGKVKPFAVKKISQLNAPPPPSLTSQEYADAYNEVKLLGELESLARTAEQTEIGIYWGYDGSPGLGTPPRLYNQIARVIALQEGNTLVENARLFAQVNIAMADAGIASWFSKYDYNFWRPIVAIRQDGTVGGPGGLDGNAATMGQADWIPLGAPASNQGGTNFTPPFPAYTSGHATFGAAAFRTIANFYGDDNIAFSFTSDELNGVTTDQFGVVRPMATRSFNSLSEAAWENAESRIYLGIHWRFDAVEGVNQGTAVADIVSAKFLKPLRGVAIVLPLGGFKYSGQWSLNNGGGQPFAAASPQPPPGLTNVHYVVAPPTTPHPLPPASNQVFSSSQSLDDLLGPLNSKLGGP
jgi:hypothetical protein